MRPMNFQSFALPAELSVRGSFLDVLSVAYSRWFFAAFQVIFRALKIVADRFATGNCGQSSIGGRRNGLADEVHAAIAEEEVAAPGMDAAEARKRIVGPWRSAKVRAIAVIIPRRQNQRLVHRFIHHRHMAATLGGDPEAGAEQESVGM